jgi:hypothetical protein
MDTAKNWKGNSSGSLEYRAYGKEPSFSRTGNFDGFARYSRDNGDNWIIHEWNNIKITRVDLGIRYNGDLHTLSEFGIYTLESVVLVIISVLVIGVIIRVAIRRHRKN